jgi:hypothetical protein
VTISELSFRSLIGNYKFRSAFVKYFLAAASIALAALAVYGALAYNELPEERPVKVSGEEPLQDNKHL